MKLAKKIFHRIFGDYICFAQIFIKIHVSKQHELLFFMWWIFVWKVLVPEKNYFKVNKLVVIHNVVGKTYKRGLND